jgi:hypothetical protein
VAGGCQRLCLNLEAPSEIKTAILATFAGHRRGDAPYQLSGRPRESKRIRYSDPKLRRWCYRGIGCHSHLGLPETDSAIAAGIDLLAPAERQPVGGKVLCTELRAQRGGSFRFALAY